jgi:hypothetical protein
VIRRPAHLLALALVASLAVACSDDGGSSSSSPSASSTSSKASVTSTTAAPGPESWTAELGDAQEVDGNYRQGVARVDGGWIFTNNNAIYRTDESFTQTVVHLDAIPPELASKGYNHLGDPDVADGVLWVPVERDDKDQALQVTARYDAETLAFVDSFEVPQHHNAWVAVADDGIVYSNDLFTDDTVLRYRVSGTTTEPLTPLSMSQSIDRIQGGDLADGALWLSTDDDHNGVYRVDLETGAVTDLGGAGHVAGEGEGIDATDLPSGLLHTVVADEQIIPMWLTHLKVSSKG